MSACLIQVKSYSHFPEGVALVSLLAGKLRSVLPLAVGTAGCAVSAFHGGAPELQSTLLGADVWAPGFWHEHYWWRPCWKASLLSWSIPGEQRGHSQNRGLSVIVNWIFLIMVLSWPEYYSVVLGMSSCGPLLLIWQLSSVCLLTSRLYLSCCERQLQTGAICLKSSLGGRGARWRWRV